MTGCYVQSGLHRLRALGYDTGFYICYTLLLTVEGRSPTLNYLSCILSPSHIFVTVHIPHISANVHQQLSSERIHRRTSHPCPTNKVHDLLVTLNKQQHIIIKYHSNTPKSDPIDVSEAYKWLGMWVLTDLQ